MCLYPRIIENKKYTENQKNGGKIPYCKDERMKAIPIGCGRCVQCRKQKSREWQFRIMEDIKKHTNGKFVTMTFSRESYKRLNEETVIITDRETKELKKIKIGEIKGYAKDNAIATKAVRLFLERWRKHNKKSLRHWFVTEIGGQYWENIHIHGIVWTDKIEEVEKVWRYGHVWTGKTVNEKKINYVNKRTASYITKYMTKVDEKHPNYKSIVLCSKGIGGNYKQKRKNYKSESGHEIKLNNYWKNKIYSEEEREDLWIEKLNENIRYIGKQKFAADDYEEILKALEWEIKSQKERRE